MKSLSKNKIAWLYLISAAFILLAVILGLLLGATELGISHMLGAVMRGDLDSPEARILIYVRLPRLLAGLACGAALALSGALIQGVLANRLASPSIIGVSSGAGLAVTLCSAFGIIGGWRLSLFAFIGALLAVVIVSLGAQHRRASRGTVILIGVALNAFLGAISDTVITLSPEISVMSSGFKIGDISSVTYGKLLPASAVILVAATVAIALSKELDVLTLGDETARGLGLNASLTRALFLILSALLAGAAVSVAGLLSFVGLIVPHAVRRIATSESKHMLPLCVMLGAAFVSLCDTVARVALAPFELPVGIIMAFIGAPFFVFILIRGRGDTYDRAE